MSLVSSLRSLDSFHPRLKFLDPRCFLASSCPLYEIYKCAFSFMKNDVYVCMRIYRLCHTVLSVRSFNNAQQFSSFLDPLPRFHLRRISLFECRFHLSVTVSLDLFLCIPLFLRVCSSIRVCVRMRTYAYVYVRIFGGCIDASSLMFHSFFLNFLFSIPFRRSPVIFCRFRGKYVATCERSFQRYSYS